MDKPLTVALKNSNAIKYSVLAFIAAMLAYPFMVGNPYVYKWPGSDFASHIVQVTQGWGLPLYYWGDWFMRIIYYPLNLAGLDADIFYLAVCILSLIGACYCIYKFTTLIHASWLSVVFILVGCYGALEYFTDAIIIDFIAMYVLGMGYLYLMHRWTMDGGLSRFVLSVFILLIAVLFHYKAGGVLLTGSGSYLVILALFKDYRKRALWSLAAVPVVAGIVLWIYSATVNGGHLYSEVGFIFNGQGELLSGPLSLKKFLTWQFNPFTLISVLASIYLIVKLRKYLTLNDIFPLLSVACFAAVLMVCGFTTVLRHPDRFGLDLSIFLCIGLYMMYALIIRNKSQLGDNWRWTYPKLVFANLGLNALIIIPRYEGI